MLQAIVKNKARHFFFRGRDRRPVEDVVTDCVFGGLRYFTPGDAGVVLEWLLGTQFAVAGAKIGEVRLWPREQGCEPDAVIEAELRDGTSLKVIIEAKWGGYGLRLGQALRQWQIFGEEALATGEVIHVVVVGHRDAALARLDGDDEIADPALFKRWEPRRTVMLWHDISKALAHRSRSMGSRELHRWATDVVSVLRQMGERPFEGFTESIRLNVAEYSGAPLTFGSRRFRWPAYEVRKPR